MSLVIVRDVEEFNSILNGEKELVVGFFGSFSQVSNEAESDFREFASLNTEIKALLVDVNVVKGVHKFYGVNSVPTVISISNNKVIQKIVGKHNTDYYLNAFQNHSIEVNAGKDKKIGFPQVTVWTGDSCVWCTRVKTYLRKNRVPFREVNVSRDASSAAALKARTGQVGVPQLSIGGNYVVGFDKTKIDMYLGLKSRKEV